MRNSRTAKERAALAAALKASKLRRPEIGDKVVEDCFNAQIDVIENDLTPQQVYEKYSDSVSDFHQDVFDHASAASDYLLGNLDAEDICTPVESEEPDPDMVNEGENRSAVNEGSGQVDNADDPIEVE